MIGLALCILSLLEHPEIVKRAQEEIDSVTGTTRLPDFGDEDAMPYTMACVKEGLRIWSFAPLGKHPTHQLLNSLSIHDWTKKRTSLRIASPSYRRRRIQRLSYSKWLRRDGKYLVGSYRIYCPVFLCVPTI